jgi:hypothetical protein
MVEATLCRTGRYIDCEGIETGSVVLLVVAVDFSATDFLLCGRDGGVDRGLLLSTPMLLESRRSAELERTLEENM